MQLTMWEKGCEVSFSSVLTVENLSATPGAAGWGEGRVKAGGVRTWNLRAQPESLSIYVLNWCDENKILRHKKTLVCRLMSWMEACEGGLCRKPHIVHRPSPETNAQKTLKAHWAEQHKWDKRNVYFTRNVPEHCCYLLLNSEANSLQGDHCNCDTVCFYSTMSYLVSNILRENEYICWLTAWIKLLNIQNF